MHDISDLEGRGIPGVFVASNVFRAASDAQSKSLGIAPARVFVPHPIQDRTDAEMVDYADLVYDELLRNITAP